MKQYLLVGISIVCVFIGYMVIDKIRAVDTLFASRNETDITKNLAHRGYSAKYPENTLLAFSEALKTGCDGIELDVHLSKDGEPVVIHDEDVKRTTNGTGLVSDMTLAELKALDGVTGEKIPLLSEYFDLIMGSDIITNIELKNNVIRYEGMEEKVLALVREYGFSEKIIFSSFNHESIDMMKSLAADIPCAYLCGQELDWEVFAKTMLEKHIELIHINVKLVNEDFLRAAKKHNIPFGVWTVNDTETIQRLLDVGAYSIFTDDPTLFRKLV